MPSHKIGIERYGGSRRLNAAQTEPGIRRERMQLGELLEGVATRDAAAPRVPAGEPIAAVAYDSRAARPGALFVAIRGEIADGNRFVGDALARGAVAVVSEQARP